jgi:hypothetical protein
VVSGSRVAVVAELVVLDLDALAAVVTSMR